MIIEVPDDNSIVRWKMNDKDEWKYAKISDLIIAYKKRPQGEWVKMKDVQDVIGPILKRFYNATDNDIEYIIQEIEQKAYFLGG